MSATLAKPYNQYQPYKAGEYIYFNGNTTANIYIALVDCGKGQSPTTASGKWQQAFSSGGSSEWGKITGTLSNQTDLQTALNGKIAGDGVTKITVSASAPISPSAGDLWIDIS